MARSAHWAHTRQTQTDIETDTDGQVNGRIRHDTGCSRSSVVQLGKGTPPLSTTSAWRIIYYRPMALSRGRSPVNHKVAATATATASSKQSCFPFHTASFKESQTNTLHTLTHTYRHKLGVDLISDNGKQ